MEKGKGLMTGELIAEIQQSGEWASLTTNSPGGEGGRTGQR